MEKNENCKNCFNCEHLMGGSNFSFGYRCKHPNNQKEEMLPIINNPNCGCDFFEKKSFKEELI